MARSHLPKVWRTIAWVCVMLVAIETGLQARSQIRYGKSVFNVLTDESTFRFDEETGLKLLRPNAVIEGTEAIIRTNAMGLRGPSLSPTKPLNELRIAILGASTVMGTHTRDNEETLSYRLEYYLQQAIPDTDIKVINAGIAGYPLRSQTRLIEQLLVPLDVDALIWYSGFNDITGYCNEEPKNPGNDHGLPKLTMPSWLLSAELAMKNTVWLRTVTAGNDDKLDPSRLDVSQYQLRVQKLLSTVEQQELPMLVVTNARAFRREMPEAEQRSLSETARYYNQCFDLDGLHDAYDRHNAIIASEAQNYGFPVYRLDEELPGGADYFGDATHFSPMGTDYVAELLAGPVESLISGTTGISAARPGEPGQ